MVSCYQDIDNHPIAWSKIVKLISHISKEIILLQNILNVIYISVWIALGWVILSCDGMEKKLFM